jgi:anti-sigma regulatory factor (Ser/Thr protein kinase)
MIEPVKLEYKIGARTSSMPARLRVARKRHSIAWRVSPAAVKRAAIAMYEAEINAVIHADGGAAEVFIYSDHVIIRIIDQGPGIPDVSLAMQEGWSTAPDIAREMGFGAGMGLPNIKKHSDDMSIETEIGKGTTVTITVRFST